MKVIEHVKDGIVENNKPGRYPVEDGKVTGTAVGTSAAAVSGLQGQTIILSPTASNGAITWAVTGTCKGDSMC